MARCTAGVLSLEAIIPNVGYRYDLRTRDNNTAQVKWFDASDRLADTVNIFCRDTGPVFTGP